MTLAQALHTEHLARQKRLWHTPPKPRPEPVVTIVDNSQEPETTASEIVQAVEQTTIVDNCTPLRMPTVREIQHVVCRHFGLTYLDLISHRRDARSVEARHCAFWLARHLTTATFPFIGLRFSGRDHTTIMHGVQKIQAKQEIDRELAAVLEGLKAAIADLVARGGLIGAVT